MTSLWQCRSEINLIGNNINVDSGKWTCLDAIIGSGVDSYFEYLVKAGILPDNPERGLFGIENSKDKSARVWVLNFFY